MSNLCRLCFAVALQLMPMLAAASSVEVLYLAETKAGRTSLLTYNVNPVTAAATEVGQPVSIGATSVDPVTVGVHHLVYVWNSKNVWSYLTDAHGVPDVEPEQHLAFEFPNPVTTFVADPDGKFAYAGVIWWDSQTETNNATLYLFAIDPSTGELTNLEEAVAQYGPNPYIGLTGFSFGRNGNKLLASYFNNGPYTCELGYGYYPVNQSTGHLGSLENIVEGGSCSGNSAVAVTDQIAGGAGGPCGQGCGGISVLQISTGKEIECTPSMLTFCGDDVAPSGLYFDPAGKNVFFTDADTSEIYIGHLNFAKSIIIESNSAAPGDPQLFFSPDSLLVYAQYKHNVEIYGFRSSTGMLTTNTSLAIRGKLKITTATLQN
jgi:hypothetical protein